MADGNDNGIQLTYKGPVEHLDNLIPMLNPQQAQEAAGGLPAMPSAPPPPAAAPPVLGRTTLGMVQPMPAVEMGTPSMPAGPAPRTLLGKVGHGLGIAGEIAGTAFAPRLMPVIPGTEQYKMRESALEQEKASEAADTGLKGAQSDYYEAQAFKDLHPEAKSLPGAEEQAFESLIAKGVAPMDAYRQVKQAALSPTKPAVTKGVYTDPQGNEFQGHIEPGVGIINDVTGQPVPDAKIYEKPAAAVHDAYHEWLEANPGKTYNDFLAAQAKMKSEFPRLVPVTDAQGNIHGVIGYTGTAGGISARYIPNTSVPGLPQNLGSVPGVIPPKPTSSVLTQSQRAEMIQPQVKSLTEQIEKVAPELGPFKGRLADVITGKVGADNPAIARLQMQLQMFTTALMLAHGLRGEQYANELGRYLSAAQSPQNLIERVKAANEYLQDYVSQTGHGPAAPSSAASTGPAATGAGGNVISWKDLK